MKVPVRCRFPNFDAYTVVHIGPTTFKPVREFEDEIFGYIDETYVALVKSEWKIANNLWNHDTSTESQVPGGL